MKIVAIGGGNNSDVRKNGAPQIYEHQNIDLEIIRISGKSKPNILYIPHASDNELGSYQKIVHTYKEMYHCPVKNLGKDYLDDYEMVDELVNWADVIYVGGGNTKEMLDLWYRSGFNEKLIDAGKNNKVLCGTSAGGGCWFKYMCSDYLQMETGNSNAPFMPVKGLGLVDLIFNPHAGEHGRMRSIKNITELNHMRGISLTDNMAIEIVDDEYKLIEGFSNEGVIKEAILSYWKDGEYWVEPIEEKGLIKELIDGRKKDYQKRK